MGTKKALLKDLQIFVKRISKEYPLQKVILFGSQATGKTHKNSDVDLILVSKKFEGISRLDRSPDLYLQWDLDYPVDFLCYTPKEFNKKKKQISIVQKAVHEGIEVYAA